MEHKIGARDEEWFRLRLDGDTDLGVERVGVVSGERYDDAVKQLEALRESRAAWRQEALRLRTELSAEVHRLRGVFTEIQDKASGFAGYTGCFLQWGAHNYERAKERGIKLADIYNYVTEALKS